jgi:hypothetical protein
VAKGLVTLDKELAEGKKAVVDIEAALGENAARAEKLKKLTTQLTAHRDGLAKRKAEVDGQIQALAEELAKGAKAVAEAETAALGLYKKAGQAYKRASSSAQKRGGELTGDPTMEDISKDKDTAPAMVIGQGDAAHAAALVYLQQIRNTREQMTLIGACLAAKVPGFDEAKLEELAGTLAGIQEQAGKAVEESLKLLTGRKAQNVNKNYQWIPQVSAAATYQLKWLLEGDEADDALAQAIEQYQQAVEGREGSPFLKPYVRIVSRLQAAAGDLPDSPAPSTAEAEEEADEAEEKPAKSDKEAKSEPAEKKKPAAAPKRGTPPRRAGRK